MFVSRDEAKDGRKREDSEEDQLWCDSQEEVLKLTGS